MCSLVLAFTTPVSAGYWFEKDVSADDFVNALVDYCNHNEVKEGKMVEISNHQCWFKNLVKTPRVLDFDYDVVDTFVFFWPWTLPIPTPIPANYKFSGHVHANWQFLGLVKPYELDIFNGDRNFLAHGFDWVINGNKVQMTRFYANDDEPNRQKLTVRG